MTANQRAGCTHNSQSESWLNTVNSPMFAGIKVSIFGTKPCSRALIFAVSSGLVKFLGTYELCLQVFIFAR